MLTPSKHLQRIKRAVQDAALHEVMENRASNGGAVDFGFIQKIIDK
jgi:hypothetical protein